MLAHWTRLRKNPRGRISPIGGAIGLQDPKNVALLATDLKVDSLGELDEVVVASARDSLVRTLYKEEIAKLKPSGL